MRPQARGAALGIVLVLLAGLGALALAAAAAATTALALAGHQQAELLAFEAAEAGIAAALAAAAREPAPRATGPLPWPDEDAALVTLETRTEAVTGIGALAEGYTIGENAGGFASRHYLVTAEGRADRGARVQLEQGFYVAEPAP